MINDRHVTEERQVICLSAPLHSVNIMGNPSDWQIKCETHHLLRKQEDMLTKTLHTFGNIFLFKSISSPVNVGIFEK